MLIAHISDFHVFADKAETSLVRPDAVDVARKVVADMVAFQPGFDAVMFTGDITDGGSERDYALARSILAPIKAPIFMVPGNHDHRDNMRSAFANILPFTDRGYLNYESSCGPIRVLGLDTLFEGHVEGRLEPESLTWLEERLSTVTSGQTYLLLHHPPFASGMKPLDDMALTAGKTRLAELVRGYEGRLHILSGHIHRPYQTIWNGAMAAVGGSPAFQVGLEFSSGAHEPGAETIPYSYFIHHVGPENISIFNRPVCF